MISTKYIGMDVHKESISIAVMNSVGKVVMECVIETKASIILQFFNGLTGDLHVTFEEGTAAAWLYDLLKPHVARLVVCNPRRNALLKVGNKSDRIDARKLAELLRGNQIHPVYHGEHGLRALKELVRSYSVNFSGESTSRYSTPSLSSSTIDGLLPVASSNIKSEPWIKATTLAL